MRKKQVTDLPDRLVVPDALERVTRRFEFEIITPMFGGDATSWQLDKVNPVRAQSIKGQLRFWWRTMQNEPDHDRLLHRENELWGGVTGNEDGSRIKSPASLSVQVTVNPRWHQFMLDEKGFAVKEDLIPKYVSFPVTDRLKKGEIINYVSTMEFRLTLTCNRDLESEMLNTLTLWTLFGGVGARTRRGTGSLYCQELLERFDSDAAIMNFIKLFSQKRTALAYPTLAGARLYATDANEGTAAEAWKSLLSQYGKFRQQRTPNHPKPGRSYWPEPDAIRRLTGKHAKHAPVHPDGIWFPRAAFGLPVIFRFQDPRGTGDPDGQFSLEPDGGTGSRFPSTTILKAIRLASGRVIKVMLVLGQRFPERLQLKGSGGPFRLDDTAMPRHAAGKTMVTQDPLKGRTIHGVLADHLKLREVTTCPKNT